MAAFSLVRSLCRCCYRYKGMEVASGARPRRDRFEARGAPHICTAPLEPRLESVNQVRLQTVQPWFDPAHRAAVTSGAAAFAGAFLVRERGAVCARTVAPRICVFDSFAAGRTVLADAGGVALCRKKEGTRPKGYESCALSSEPAGLAAFYRTCLISALTFSATFSGSGA